ncbi:hypothetical protein ACQW5G_01240 [Fructilactobacillus sp. Tb1]|uniref:hypothetical protein n=1 Tax=Fructilactobacillus sp. Tb1 TaxID=3422304 RepID=UPI003D2D322E
MTKEQVIEKYKAGFTFGEDYETIEWLLNKKKTMSDTLFFDAYDANLIPLPNMGEWIGNKARQVQIDFMINKLKDWDGSIYLDDIKVK